MSKNRNRRAIRRTAAILAFCAVMAAAPTIPSSPMEYFTTSASAAGAVCSFSDLQKMYPNGSQISYYSNQYGKCRECVAGAYQMGELISGSSPYTWKMITNKQEIANYINGGSLKPTDILRFGSENYGHTFMVTGVYNHNITYVDCNGIRANSVLNWGGGAVVYGNQGFFTDSQLSSAYGVTSIDYIRVSPVDNVSNYEGFSTPGLAFAKTFDADYYRRTYSDLQSAFGENSAKLAEHFLRYGAAEGRRPGAGYDPDAYYGRYEDLRRAFGSDRKALFNHYITYGYYEQRNAGKSSGSGVIQNGSVVRIGIGNTMVNLYGNYFYNSARICSWENDGSIEQTFGLVKASGAANTYYIVCGGNSEYCIDALRINGRVREYSRADIWQTGTDPEAQEWLIEKVGNNYAIKLASNSSLCLTMMSTNNNVDLALTKFCNASNQLFEINPA